MHDLVRLLPEDREALLALVKEHIRTAHDNLPPEQLRTLVCCLQNPFVPKMFIGLEGGMVNGATTNCAIDYLVADHDTEGADQDEITYLPTWNCDAVIGGPGSLIDPEKCEALFAEALKEESDEDPAA